LFRWGKKSVCFDGPYAVRNEVRFEVKREIAGKHGSLLEVVGLLRKKASDRLT
jgi:hypothetical protein